ncbi:MAG: DUF4857 domain-containing protein [Mangrovibacterium sp.]
MITKKSIQALIIVLSTLLLFIILPWLTESASRSSYRYPFSYYSSLKNDFINYQPTDSGINYHDSKGNNYSRFESDSILPLLNYRQLLKDGRAPHSIAGRAVDTKIVQHNQFFFRYSPKKKNCKTIGLYPMYESMSGRINLETPEDMFSLKDDIHFINCESNRIEQKKSALFQQALERHHFRFPAQWVAGNPSAKKAYDEGWFALDSKNEIYHIKMVNGKPFVKNINLPKQMHVVHMETIETANHITYGFIFTSDGNIYYLADTSYEPVQIPIPTFDVNNDQLSILTNLLYWNVYVTTAENRYHYAFESGSLKEVDKLQMTAPKLSWQKAMEYLFPTTIKTTSPRSTFIYPEFSSISTKAIFVNLLCVLLLVLVSTNINRKELIPQIIFVILTGICGLIPILLFRNRSTIKKNIIQLK